MWGLFCGGHPSRILTTLNIYVLDRLQQGKVKENKYVLEGNDFMFMIHCAFCPLNYFIPINNKNDGGFLTLTKKRKKNK